MDSISSYNSFRKVDVHGPQPDIQLPELEVQGPPPDVQLLTSSKIKLVAAGKVQKSSVLKVKSNPALDPPVIVTWIIDM